MVVKVSLAEKFGKFADHWGPRIVARYNGNEVRLVKASGTFHWHSHKDTDELFLVIEGVLNMQFRDRVEVLVAGDMIVVPCGTEHRPCVPEGEARLLLIDRAGTPNTGDVASAFKEVEV